MRNVEKEVIPIYSTAEQLSAMMKIYGEDILSGLTKVPKKRKVMPKGIKRPGQKMNYDIYNLRVFTAMLRAPGCSYKMEVPEGHKTSNFQSAMINAAYAVYKERGRITTRVIARNPDVIEAIRLY